MLSKIHSTVTIATVAGTMSNCSTDGGLNCATSATFPAANTSGAGAKILTGQTVAGVPGTAATTPSNCSGDNGSGCVAIAAFPSVVKANVTLDKIKAGTTIAGVTGVYPNATYPLPSSSGAQLTSATFAAKIKDATAFEYYTSAGVRQTGSGDPEITGSNIKSGVDIFGASGTYGSTCAADNVVGCMTTSVFKSANTSAYTSWDIRKGDTIGGIAGTLQFNVNSADLTVYNNTVAPATSGTGTIDNFDSLNDKGLPTGTVTALPAPNRGMFVRTAGQDTGVGGGIANDGICNGTEMCTFLDKNTTILWAKPPHGAMTWQAAVSYCYNLNYNGTGWRLPSIKEYSQAYIDGLFYVGVAMDVSTYYWTMTTNSAAITKAFAVVSESVETTIRDKTESWDAICVR